LEKRKNIKTYTMNVELRQLKAERDKLNERIAEIEKQELSNALSFKEKLKIWYDSENGEELDWIPGKEEYPKLREYIHGADMDRHRTYDLRDFFEDDIYCILEGDESEVREKSLEVLKEAVEKNLHSFKMDW